jgi:hypothetical protein
MKKTNTIMKYKKISKEYRENGISYLLIEFILDGFYSVSKLLI